MHACMELTVVPHADGLSIQVVGLIELCTGLMCLLAALLDGGGSRGCCPALGGGLGRLHRHLPRDDSLGLGLDDAGT